jgi:hypothetical protein
MLVWYWLIESWRRIFGKTLPSSKVLTCWIVFHFTYDNCSLYGFILPLSSLQRTIYIPQPTWGNHPKIFTLAGLSVKTYRYYDPATRGLNFQGLKLSYLLVWIDCFYMNDKKYQMIFFNHLFLTFLVFLAFVLLPFILSLFVNLCCLYHRVFMIFLHMFLAKNIVSSAKNIVLS